MSWWNKETVSQDTDPHFVKFCELAEINDQIYASEAEQLLITKQLTKTIGHFRVEYLISNRKAGYEMFDLTSNDQLIEAMEGPLPKDKKRQIEDIKELLAHSEASALIESK